MWSDGDYYSDEESDGEPFLSLREEVRRGDSATVRRALENGADPNDTDAEQGGYSLLHWAVGVTDPESMDEVVPKKYQTRRLLPARKEIVKMLLENGARAWTIWWQQSFLTTDGVRVWHLAEDDSDVEKWILEAAVQQSLQSSKELDYLQQMMLNGGLCAASTLGLVSEVNQLVEAGAEVNDDTCDETALSLAAGGGFVDVVKVLVTKHKAVVDHDVNGYGTTALRIAASNGHGKVVDFLLESGANVFIETEAFGPLPMGARGHPRVLRTLITHIIELIPDRGANEWCYTQTAFHVLIALGAAEGVRTLLSSGARPPEDALDRAAVFGQLEVLELLLAEGALSTHKPSKVHYYGCSSNQPSPDLVQVCQKRLKETVEARNEWNEHAARLE